tara:strand:+ start:15439 stop:17271 length:1833 start_codon:yes stop_codon:yes gene_type:complete
MLVVLTMLAMVQGIKADVGDGQSYSPPAGRDYPTRVYWGDTHLHTRYSVDANMFGNQHLGPAEAFRFARGETVAASNGMLVRLNRPLDFLVVSDHGEFLGLLPGVNANDPGLTRFSLGRRWQSAAQRGDLTELMQLWGTQQNEEIDGEPFAGPKFAARVWDEYAGFADSANQPGVFTAFIGYEWTGMNNLDNLHRNIIFADDAETATRLRPFTSRDSADPEDLWRHLAKYEAQSGGRALAIPHNSNLSGGLMFRPRTAAGKNFDTPYARLRARWEPLVEITQIKGDSETHPIISPNDEFADFGTWNTNLSMRTDVSREDDQVQYEYVRSALQLGLRLEDQLGVNPFQFGVIGSTDSHTGLATADDDNYWGKFSKDNPHKGRAFEPTLPEQFGPRDVLLSNWQQLASGYAAVWAQANTRAALFDALKRKEVYATTGPRMLVRFFGGWHYSSEDALSPDLAERGYRKGVPMGGELPPHTGNYSAPRFLISASKDPEGANLERLQIIKGWLDQSGDLQEKIYDVAVTDNPGNTVNLEAAGYLNSAGSAQLAAVWQDPHFDPLSRAFYYLRVLEIPTPRWPVHDARFFGDPLPPEGWRQAQQRAYTSAIWYKPG